MKHDDVIGSYLVGGEPASKFGPDAIVYSEMAVRAMLLKLLEDAQ